MDLLTPRLGIFFWQFITFVVVLLVLKRFAWGTILEILDNRQRSIDDAIKNGRKLSSDIVSFEKTKVKLLKDVEAERRKIVKKAMDEYSIIVDKARVDAQRIADELVNETTVSLERERQRAMEECKSDMIAMSIMVAEQLLSRELSQENKQSELLDSIVDKFTKCNVAVR